jgi:hypothetical protein
LPPPYGARLPDRIRVELVEADVEIIFSLLDSAEDAFTQSDTTFATRAIDDAENVFRDIEERLLRLGGVESGPFATLVGELRREIDAARKRCS